ncbi:hypothetical protein Pcinc_011421 [Petrolisthes cinctipes]|uniref:Uncharacterized protein n=1 Tax=Petrolisthes cinctipes TaxID=88211 RepID=A0AAE1G3M7_PETCI|nr:hypothetical protein Pcinc_011421 [Petrolisthes cinctipes]
MSSPTLTLTLVPSSNHIPQPLCCQLFMAPFITAVVHHIQPTQPFLFCLMPKASLPSGKCDDSYDDEKVKWRPEQ